MWVYAKCRGERGGGGTTFSRPPRQYWTGGERAPIQDQQKAEANVTDSRSRSLHCERNTHHTTRDTTHTSPAIHYTATPPVKQAINLLGFLENGPSGGPAGAGQDCHAFLSESPRKKTTLGQQAPTAVLSSVTSRNTMQKKQMPTNQTKRKNNENTRHLREKNHSSARRHTPNSMCIGGHIAPKTKNSLR